METVSTVAVVVAQSDATGPFDHGSVEVHRSGRRARTA